MAKGFNDWKKDAPPREDVPFDIDMEQAVIGSLIRNNDLIDVAASDLEPEDFYDPFHQRIFLMVTHLRTEGDVTPLILHSVMRTDPAIKELDGQNYFQAMRDSAPGIPNLRDWTTILLDLSRRRRMIEMGERMIAGARETEQFGISSIKMAEEATDELASLMVGTKGGKHRRGIPVHESLDNLLHAINEQASAETPVAISTGFPRLDGLIGGWLPGKFYVAGGRPGMGKTILATTAAKNAAFEGAQADYYSGEMDDFEISARLGCDIDFDRCEREKLKPLAYQDFVNLKPTPEGMVRMAEARGKLAELDIEFFDSSRLTIEFIVSNARRRKRLFPNKRFLIIVDHLGKVHWEGKPRDTSRVGEISYITDALKALAKELNVPVLALSQLTRDIESREDKHPRQADFRDGGSVEENADVLFGVMRPARYAAEKLRAAKDEEQIRKAIVDMENSKGRFEIAILKQRAGPEADYFDLAIDERASALRDNHASSMPEQDLFFGAGNGQPF